MEDPGAHAQLRSEDPFSGRRSGPLVWVAFRDMAARAANPCLTMAELRMWPYTAVMQSLSRPLATARRAVR